MGCGERMPVAVELAKWHVYTAMKPAYVVTAWDQEVAKASVLNEIFCLSFYIHLSASTGDATKEC